MSRTLSFITAFFLGSVVSFALVTIDPISTGSPPPTFPPDGKVGLPYPPDSSSPNPFVKFSSDKTAKNRVWRATVVPKGLIFNRQGILSGKPKKAGNFTITVFLKSGRTTLDTGTFRINIVDTANPVISGNFTLPAGQFDQPYQAGTPNNGYKLSATGGYPFSPTQSKYPTGYYWRLIPGKTLDETLPKGMTLNANGVISGTPVWPKCPVPVASKEYKLKVRATDFLGKSSTANFILRIDPPVAPDIISDCPLPDGTELAVYPLVQLKASGGKQYYTWSIVNGEFPPGLKFNSKGYISGTPAKDSRHPYTYKFKIKVTDRNCLTDEKNCEITIYPALTCNHTINLPCLYQGMVLANTTISSASGGKPPYNWSILPVRGSVKTLPASLSQVAGNGSAISGTITENGTFSFISKVTDANGYSCSQNHTIIVHPQLEITTICPLDKGKIQMSYSENLTAKGGKTPYFWELVPLNTGLPSGLMLDPVTGIISGIPVESGNFTFSYKVKDSCNQEKAGNCTIRIAKECECVLETTENGSSLGIALDTSGSTYGIDVLVNGVTKSRRDAFNQVLTDYGLASHPNRYDEPGSSTTTLDSMISKAILALGTSINNLNIIILNDSEDSGLSNWNKSNAAYASVANSNLKINIYYIRIAGSAIHPTVLSELTSFISSKPSYVTQFYQNTFTQYNTGDASELNNILAEAFGSRYLCTDSLGNEIFVSNKDAKSVEEAENIICNPIVITPETEINIWYDASGSMSEVFSVLEKMHSEVLKPCLLQFFNGNGTLFDQRVKVREYYDERAFSVLNTPGSTSAITQVINVAFSDEAQSNYHSDLNAFDGSRTTVHDADIAALRGTLLAKPSYIRGAVLRITGFDGFLSFLDASKASTGAYAGNFGLADQNDIRVVRNVARPSGGVGIATPLPGSPMYYGNQIINALNSMGFTLKLCDKAQDPPVSLTPQIVSQNPLEGPMVGVPYQGILSAVGGILPYTWNLPTGTLPSGLTFNSTTGLISGMPTTVQTSNFSVKVTDTNNASDQKSFSLAVTWPPLAVDWSEGTPTLTAGQPADPETFTASGGDGNYSWTISSGSLPPGITLSENSGASISLSGTPTAPGTYNFRVRVSSAGSFNDIDVSYIVEVDDSPNPSQMITVVGGTLPPSSELAGQTVATFQIGKYEVTWDEWQEVRTWAVANGYSDLGLGQGVADNHPVQVVNWYDAVKWCNARSEKEGLMPVYNINGNIYRAGIFDENDDFLANESSSGYRLPSEKEWEWAARGGVSSLGYTYSGSNDINAVAWYNVNSGNSNEVGTKAENELGIYDMSGNAPEWTGDWWMDDFEGSDFSFYGRVRGGSWSFGSLYCNVADRSRVTDLGNPGDDLGFRVARSSGN